jgi:hypothetical protein
MNSPFMNNQPSFSAKLVTVRTTFVIILLISISGCQAVDDRQVKSTEIQLPALQPHVAQTATRQPLPTVTLTAVPHLIPTEDVNTLEPSPAPTSLPSNTPTSVPFDPTFAGLIYQVNGQSYRIDENGESVPWTINLSPDNHYYLDVISDLDFSNPNLTGQLYLMDQLSGERTQVPVENLQTAGIGDWWMVESDWLLLQIAIVGFSSEFTLSHSGLVNLEEVTFEFLGGTATANPLGTWVAYVGSSTNINNQPSAKAGLWLYDVQQQAHFPIDWSAYGLDFVEPPLATPTWSANGRYLSINCYWWGECEPGGALIVLDMESMTGHLLDYRYAGLEGRLYPPQWAPDTSEFLFQGHIDEHFGSWRLTPTGEVLNYWEDVIHPRWISSNQIAYLDDLGGEGWQLFDLLTGQMTALPSVPYVSPNGRFLAGSRFDTDLSLPQSWLLELETSTIIQIPLPDQATITDWK